LAALAGEFGKMPGIFRRAGVELGLMRGKYKGVSEPEKRERCLFIADQLAQAYSRQLDMT
jgi:hypothetical protein